ncbi:glycerophosphodiester phosphodiesterase [Enterococcus sp. JM4C]|uniref:glycerophosphoryl diester phosphodiesterase membrane domain-containing protein n=1 Tax=Candidatus Enterococcus huntleyi TaxID=1857217 RepID=UPI001379B9E3|nr:glycerophosphodiester phosphodiesterase [Enterococcus sp. JM4C]KAF1297460.1 glycerophosphodiester phosphodiesterase [Enterococcus sp. JM4C]
MNYLKNSLINTRDFLKSTQAYFRDVLLMHGFILFIALPLLGSSTRFILRKGAIDYLSYDNLSSILTQHPGVLVALFFVLLSVLILVFFEFTFLLLSVYFIKKKQPVSLQQLLRMTLLQMKKIRPITVLFFLFYFLLILPIGGLSFNSDLLSKIKIPAFIMDFIFQNRVIVIAGFAIGYLLLIYLGIRVIFALPEMILRDRRFRESIKESWRVTRRRFLAIIGQFVFIGGIIVLLTSAVFVIVIVAQGLFEVYLPEYALPSAVFAMTLLQAALLLNIILSTVGIFYIIVDFMDDEGFLPAIPEWFYLEPVRSKKHSTIKIGFVLALTIFFGIGVGLYNTVYLTNAANTRPVTISHRGVSDKNGVQNTLTALQKTVKLAPDYVEMDVQETKDHQFVVYHDPNLKALAGINKAPQELTLKELQEIQLTENGTKDFISSFDDYLAEANRLNQKLLIEIKTSPLDSPQLVENFIEKYQEDILTHHHMLQSLTYQTVTDLKTAVPDFTVGYILPFNIVGPPVTPADFLTMEYSTINRNFIDSAHADGKKVYVWTVNEEDDMSRMMFYGADGMVTDQMDLLTTTSRSSEDITYSDKLLNFVLGVG